VRTVFAAFKAASDAAFIFSGTNRPLSDFPAAPPAAIFTMRKAITMGANALNLTALIAVVGKPAFRFVMSSTSKIATALQKNKRLVGQLHSAEKVSEVGILRHYTYTALGHVLIATDPLPRPLRLSERHHNQPK
jgi:hypothetical protein